MPLRRTGLAAALILSLSAPPAYAGVVPMSAAAAERHALADAMAVTVQVEVERATQPDPFAGGRIRPGQVSAPRGGAGFVFDSSGLIATNAHVIAGARSVTVRLRDGRRLPAQVVGVDTTLDLAVLRVDAGGPLPAARLGDSRQAREGEAVWAIGAPMGYAFSVTSGVLSGRDRFYDETYPVELLQHDAALNPGNSGGPLFDRQGRVIGINTATPPETIFDIGVGLAIPAETAGPALARLARDGRIERGQLGISVTVADDDVAAALGAGQGGLVIDGLTDSGAARRAGLMAGDLLVAIDGAPLAIPRDLTRALLDSRPGDTARVTYFRDGAQATALVRLEGLTAAVTATAATSTADAPLDLGLTLGRSDWDGGVAVRTVRPDGPAALYGLRPGDRLRAVNGRAPASAEEAMEMLRAGRARVALLRIERTGEPPRHIVLPLTRGAAAERPAGRVVDAVVGPF